MTTLYEQLGGAPVIERAVDIFYRKMLSDERVARFFGDVDMDHQAAKQTAFLTMVTGGPNHYTARDMTNGHRHLVARGLADLHVDVVLEHLGTSFTEVGATPEQVETIQATANSVRGAVLGRPAAP
jgi:hemoglobin